MYIIRKENLKTYLEYSSSQNSLILAEFGEEISASGIKNPIHRDNFIIHFVTKGKGIFNCDDKTYLLKEGDAFVIAPSNLISYYSSGDEGWSYCWINMSGLNCNSVFEKCGLIEHKVFSYSKDDIKELLDMLDELDTLDVDSTNKDAYSLKALSMGISILSKLCNKLNPTKTENKNQNNESIMEKALDYINHNITENITVSSLCKEINVSRVYFTTLFTKKMKQSPYHYITARKIHIACEVLLAYTDLKISRVATMSGFQSTAQFCKCFKKNVGISPTEYKERNSR